ncbi:multifunctional expression regulator [Aotine betaherpesvirus 1]|uniref:mRNA export factor ICP27 homolog n=1 Tax=Aotine betaherpesvirus 1 TaxID=50290 RepID=G8XUD4_9BETA|nr:multifunctional expression regulator [Aotine betaherpesvirus 1]AEV80764.1 multifunctional expression regulator [Aotine betaherpesvirus 1]
MDYPRSRYGVSISGMDEGERRARRARRFALDYDEMPGKRARRETTPPRRYYHYYHYDAEPGGRSRTRVRRYGASALTGRSGVDLYRRRRTLAPIPAAEDVAASDDAAAAASAAAAAAAAGSTVGASGSPSAPHAAPLSQLLDMEISSMNDEELDQLSALIEQRRRLQRQLKEEFPAAAEETTSPSSTSPPYDLQRYTAESLGLVPYRDDVRKPVAFPDYHDNGRILLSHDELMQTDYIFDIRRQFDWLKPNLLQKLVVERTFSVANASSLHMLVAMVDETLSYIKYHYVHNLPVNPHDPYMSTVHSLRQLLFNKLSNVDLPCVMNERDWGPNCSLLKQLARKPVRATHMRDDTYDVQRRPASDFDHPLHQAMSFVTSFARSVALLKRRSEQSNAPMFMERFDDNHAISAYRCGMIADLIIGVFRRHECDNELCAMKLHKALQSYRLMLSFCPFDECCVLDLGPLLPEKANNQPAVKTTEIAVATDFVFAAPPAPAPPSVPVISIQAATSPASPESPHQCNVAVATTFFHDASTNTTGSWTPTPDPPVHEVAVGTVECQEHNSWNVSSTDIQMQTGSDSMTGLDLPDYDNILSYSDMDDDDY